MCYFYKLSVVLSVFKLLSAAVGWRITAVGWRIIAVGRHDEADYFEHERSCKSSETL